MQFIKTRDVKSPERNVSVKSTVLRNIVNGSYSKLHEKYIFERKLNNED